MNEVASFDGTWSQYHSRKYDKNMALVKRFTEDNPAHLHMTRPKMLYLVLTLDLRTAMIQNSVWRCGRLCPERKCYTKSANDDDTRGLLEPLSQWL